MPKVSAILTTYNVDAYVATSIQSIIDTGFEDLEVLVVDDGSVDYTRAIIHELIETFRDRVEIRPIFFSRNTIGGVATAANFGLSEAKGDIIVFVDGDDWVIPSTLKRAVSFLENSDHDFILTDCSEYWNDTGKYNKYPEANDWRRLEANSGIEAQRTILLNMAPFPWRKIYRRSFLSEKKIKFPIGDFMFEDNPFHWETSVKARSFGILREVTHIHRMGRAGQTVGNVGASNLRIFQHFDIIREMLEKTGQQKNQQLQLLRWLIKHLLWVSERVAPTFLNEVFEKSRRRLSQFDADLFWHGVVESGLSSRDMRRVAAVYLDSRFEFFREF